MLASNTDANVKISKQIKLKQIVCCVCWLRSFLLGVSEKQCGYSQNAGCDNERCDGGGVWGGAARRLLILSSFKQPCLIRRTPLIFGLFTSLQDKSLATTMATHTVSDVKCMARSTHH